MPDAWTVGGFVALAVGWLLTQIWTWHVGSKKAPESVADYLANSDSPNVKKAARRIGRAASKSVKLELPDLPSSREIAQEFERLMAKEFAAQVEKYLTENLKTLRATVTKAMEKAQAAEVAEVDAALNADLSDAGMKEFLEPATSWLQEKGLKRTAALVTRLPRLLPVVASRAGLEPEEVEAVRSMLRP